MMTYTFEHEHTTRNGWHIVGEVEVEYEYEKPENRNGYGIKILSLLWLGDGDIELDDDIVTDIHKEKMVEKWKDQAGDDSPLWKHNPREE